MFRVGLHTVLIFLLTVLFVNVGFSRLLNSINWTVSAQEVPYGLIGSQIGIYNEILYAIGGRETSSIYRIPLINLTQSSAATWTTSDWSTTEGYGSVSDMEGSQCSVQINDYLYIVAPGPSSNYGEMYIYNFALQAVVSSTTYDYSMPVAVSWPCMF